MGTEPSHGAGATTLNYAIAFFGGLTATIRKTGPTVWHKEGCSIAEALTCLRSVEAETKKFWLLRYLFANDADVPGRIRMMILLY
jgi:hypothetical protein